MLDKLKFTEPLVFGSVTGNIIYITSSLCVSLGGARNHLFTNYDYTVHLYTLYIYISFQGKYIQYIDIVDKMETRSIFHFQWFDLHPQFSLLLFILLYFTLSSTLKLFFFFLRAAFNIQI